MSQYRDTFEADYDALRHGAGAVEIARDFLRVRGPDALEYLQGQCSQDLAPLEPGASVDSLILEPQGKLVALVRITRTGHEELVLDVSGGYGDTLRARLERFKLRVKAEIDSLEWRCTALRGAKAPSYVDLPSPSSGCELVLPYSWAWIEGVDLLGPAPSAPEAVRRCSVEALESLRVEAGVPEMGFELDERTIAAEAGLLDRCVSFTKGCYTGQELIARLDARGNRVARRLRGIVVRDRDIRRRGSEPAITRGSDVLLGAKLVGSLTSVAWCPGVGGTGALGYLHRDVVPPCEVALRPGGGEDRALAAAEAVELPLVP